MRRIIFISIIMLLTKVAAIPSEELKTFSLPQLEQRLTEINTELEQLAQYSLRSGIGSIGFRSHPEATAEHHEWVEITLKKRGSIEIDEIILVPTLRRDTTKGFRADAFPAGFRILAGTDKDRTGVVIAEYDESDKILPRIAPLIIPVDRIKASWIRIETTQLTPRAFDQKFLLQLAEVMVFSDGLNFALRRPTKTSSSHRNIEDGTWDDRFLTDGHTPYLMNASHGPQSIAFLSPRVRKPSLTLDLETNAPISAIHLHAVDQSDTIPQSHPGDLGIPKYMRFEGANRPDFSDATTLLEYRLKTINDAGPIMMWRIPPTTCRYIRLITAPEKPIEELEFFRLGFAEIEFYSKGKNIAQGKVFKTKHSRLSEIPFRELEALTDGSNLYGHILPIQTWMHELARRHDLETERPLIENELTLRYALQKRNLRRVSWFAALLVALVIFTVMGDHIFRLRQIARIRERFAADLHDELGANLHAIGLLGDLAKAAVNSPKELIETVTHIRALTERSGLAVRHCANMQQSDIFGKLQEDMERTARRIMVNTKYNLSIQSDQLFDKLKPRLKSDLFLFYKESLVNISRHSGATYADISLTTDGKEILLSISDNGQGLADDVPSSLKRRARLLGGQVSSSPLEQGGGTCIKLTFNPNNKIRRFI